MSEAVNSDNVQTTNTQERNVRLVDVAVTDQNVGLNLMVAFLNLAQKRGAFTFEESGKIWECVNAFSTSKENVPSPPVNTVVPSLNTESLSTDAVNAVSAESSGDDKNDGEESEEQLKARLEALESQLETPRE